VGRTTVTDREIDVSRQLVEVLATDWDPARFSDEYREGLLQMIAERTPERVADGHDVDAISESRVGELLDALRRSVEEAKARGKAKGGRRAG